MKNYVLKLIPAAFVAATLTVPVAASAGEMSPQIVTVQSEVSAPELPGMTDIIFEAALANAAVKTIDHGNEWFRVTYRDIQTETVTRNIDDSAESRYSINVEGNRVERIIETKDVLVQTQKIEFELGEGPQPSGAHIYNAQDLVLPES